MLSLSRLLKICSLVFLIQLSHQGMSGEVRSCFYDSILGQFMVMGDAGKWESFPVKDESHLIELRCEGEVALFYDGENLVFWDSLEGFTWSGEAAIKGTILMSAVSSEVAAFYDGYSLFVKARGKSLVHEKGVWQRSLGANLIAYKDSASFYDGGDWFFIRAEKTFRYHKLFKHASKVTQTIGPKGALLYDGINLHSFCDGGFVLWGDSPYKARARVSGVGLVIDESYYYLDSNCKLQRTSSALKM